MSKEKSSIQLSETTKLLYNSARITRETETLGYDTLSSLQGQRGTLEKSKEELRSIREIVASASKGLTSLENRDFLKHIFLWTIIICLSLLNAVLLYHLTAQ